MRDYSYLYDLGLLLHRPIIEPSVSARPDEHIMAARWTTLMTDSSYSQPPFGCDGSRAQNLYLVQILSDLGVPITQRHASVCASFIAWLGTSCGQGLMQAIEKSISTYYGGIQLVNRDKWATYVAEWNILNMRRTGFNHGMRLIEYILAPKECFNDRMELILDPNLSAEDYETVDKLVMWLATRDGKSFVSNAFEEIATKRSYHKII